MKTTFANNIDKDILTAIANGFIPNEPVTNNNIKCSKSVVPNALYYISKGETVEFFLGNMKDYCKSIITHCWIEHNDEVAQTHMPEPGYKLFKNFSVVLSPDIEKAKKEIKELVEFILE